MLLCNETVTLIHCELGLDDEEYICTPIEGVSWFGKAQITQQQDGFVGGMVVKARIPEENMPEGVTPKEKDVLARGRVENVDTLQDLKGVEHFKIMAVGDNRRGRLRHWVVSGA